MAETAIADMKARGAIIVDPTDIPTLGTFDDAELDVLLYEFKSDLNKYLAWLGPASPVHSLTDVIAFNNAHRDEELPYFGQELFLMADAKGPLTSPAYTRARVDAWGYAGTYGIDGVMAKYRLDALVALTGGPAGADRSQKGDDRSAFMPGLSGIAAVAGYPHITVPAGYIRGLPVGISFVGRAWSEPTLIKLAYAYEQATKASSPADVRTICRISHVSGTFYHEVTKATKHTKSFSFRVLRDLRVFVMSVVTVATATPPARRRTDRGVRDTARSAASSASSARSTRADRAPCR